LEAAAPILCLAFALCSAFTLLHSKLVRLRRISSLEVARQLYRSLWQWQPPIRAPAAGLAVNSRFEPRNFRNVLMQLGLSRNALIPKEFPGGSILSRVFVSLIRCHL
jgi:hypothetical protein